MMTIRDHQYGNETAYGIRNEALRYTWAGYYLFVLASSLIGDTIILVASIKYGTFKIHKAIKVTIIHIAICDLIMSFTDALPKFVSIISSKWLFGQLLCDLTPYATYYLNLTSLFLVCNMTTIKLLILKYPLRSGMIPVRTTRVLCWLVALTLPVTFFLVYVLDGQDSIEFSYRMYHCHYMVKSHIWNWLTPFLTVSFMFLPECMVVATTIWLLIEAKQVARRGRESLKWQGIVTTVLTATVYCVSTLPYAVYYLGENMVTVDNHSQSFFHTSFYRLAIAAISLNTISNFYIYSLSVQSFRDFIWSRMQQAYRLFNNTRTSTGLGRYGKSK